MARREQVFTRLYPETLDRIDELTDELALANRSETIRHLLAETDEKIQELEGVTFE